MNNKIGMSLMIWIVSALRKLMKRFSQLKNARKRESDKKLLP
jgi:hypothetical protein